MEVTLLGLLTGGCSVMLAGWLPRFLEAQYSVDEERVGEGISAFISALARMKASGGTVSWIEAVIACLFTAGAGLYAEFRWGTSPEAGAFILFTGVLACAALIDLEHEIIPDILVLPLLWAGLLFNASGTFAPLQSAVYGAAAGYCSLWALSFLFKLVAGQAGMYGGDFKMFAAIGAWAGVEELVPALLIALVVFVLNVVARLTTKNGNMEVPFGPYLAIGGIVALGAGGGMNFLTHLLR